MIRPSLTSVVSHLIHQGLDPIVPVLWPFSPLHGEPPKFTFDELHLGDLGHDAAFVRDLKCVSNLLCIL
jgi:hypothetical protein